MGQALKRAPRRGVAAKRSQVVGSKGGSSKPKQPSIASNSMPSIATVRMLYLWSWGPIVGPVNDLRSVKLDGTPVMAEDGTLNYPGVKWQFRSGDLNQEPMTGVSESSNEIAVGQQLLSTTPYIYTITNSMLDAVRLRFSWPQLQSQDSGGNVDGVRIEYAIDVSTDNGPYQQVLASEVNRKNVTKYERSHRIELPPGSRWAIRARRITPERNSSLVQDGMYVEAIAEVVDSDQEYPLTAVSCVEYDAEQFGGDIAKIAVLMRGRIVRVPMNYDPETRTYATGGPGTTNGVWDGTFKEAYTNNPAWVFYDLALHPYYGLGDRIDPSMVNRWSLYRIGQYCDQMVPDGKGGEEPRFTCNLYLQKQAEAWAVLQDLAAIFHGLAFWDGSQITVNADMPQDPVYNYTLSQILDDGAVKYTGSKLRERHSQAMVSFDDPDRGYDTDKEPVFDEDAIAEYGVREISVEAVGCTSRGQAQRAGQWALMTEQLQLRGASFRVGLDGYIPKPGKVITLSDPMLAGRANGGRIAAVAGRVVTVDRDIDVPSGARLLVNLPSGKSEARQVRSVAGRQITVMADFSEVPQAECGWVLDFDDLKVMQFYVRNVTRPEWHQFQLECIQYEPSKFDAIDYGTVIDDRPISVLPPGVQDAPARVLINSNSAVDQGIAVTTMTISWDAAPGAVAYEVEWRWGARDWVKVPRTGELAADIRGVYAGQYMARVRAVSAMDVSSIPTTSVLTDVAGKTTPPPAVTHLTASSLIFGISLKWGIPPGAEDTQRTEIWYGPSTDQSLSIKLTDLAYPQSEYVMSGLAAGARFFFWARLVDRSGNIGPWYPVAPTAVQGIASTDAGPVLELISGQITESELGQNLLSEIEKISGEGPESVNGRIEAAKQELEGLITDLTDPLEYVATNAYAKDDAVRSGQRLYMAIAPVPAAANGSNAPPNPTYWVDIGSIASTANGLAQAVAKNTTDIATVDGKVMVSAAMLQAVQSAYRDDNGEGALNDALRGWDTLAKVSEETRTRATQNEAMATRLVVVESRVDDNIASVRSLERTVATNESATASRLTEVNTKVAGNTASISQLETTVTDNESSTASRLQSVNARVDAANQALDQEKLDRDGAVTGERQAREAAVENEATVRADADEALGLLVETVSAQVDENTGKIQVVEQAQADTNQAVASMRTNIEAVYTAGRDDNAEGELSAALKGWESTAKIAEESKTRATAIDAQAKKTETLEVSFNSGLDKANGDIGKTNTEVQKTSAAVQVTSQALAALDDKASTMWSVKMQVNAQGQYVAAGIGLGIENGPAGLQSKFLVSADLFAVVNGINGTLSSPFAVQGGQVFMNEAFIQDGTITNAKIGSYISSTNYVAGQQGWILNKSGTFEINGTVAGQGRLLINNQRLRIYHANGGLAIDLGVNV
ncbi:phage tail tip fiber protein [Pseudomonas asiatica]|uniref:phage tail tip fiber protein n=1 Tax=Pseudomonas asiatica TaxID=2219225 RepID=UPI0021755847|nr:phage tail protein [Pseudomonas asiatica]